MQCLSPIILKNKRATLCHTKQVPCGKCAPCLEKKRADWSIRLREELRVSVSAIFLTLTYSDEYLPFDEKIGIPTLKKSDLQNFMKRLRANVDYAYPNDDDFNVTDFIKLKYFACGEYGTKKERPHYHIILFNLPKELENLVLKSWTLGNVHFGECNHATIHYTSGYLITKNDPYFSDLQKPFALMSKGLGFAYINRMGNFHRKNDVSHYTALGGEKLALPKYIRHKIFDEKQRIVINAKNNRFYQRSQKVIQDDILSTDDGKKHFFDIVDQRKNQYQLSREKFLNKSKKL
ncbi:MAG: replication initiator protein [Microviridae sp.]|nr:MAG: replication initiator protein [Microviridae sp.]